MVFLPKLVVKDISPASAMVYEIMGGVFVGFCVLIFLNFKPEFHWKAAGLSFLMGVVGFLGTLTLVRDRLTWLRL